MGASSSSLMKYLNTFGLLFESYVIRDLRVYTEPLRGKIYHYRDSSGLEADAVIVLDDGRWGVIEIKLGANQIDKAALTLLKANKYFDKKENTSKPSAFVVMCGLTNASYKHEDGVMVVGINSLRL